MQLNVYHAKSKFSSLLAEVEEKGETVLICRNGRAIAELRPISKKGSLLEVHPQLSQIQFNEDPVLGLDPEDWASAFEEIA